MKDGAMKLALPENLRAQIVAAARAAFPRECCGLIIGNRGGETLCAAALHPARNLAGEAERFEIAPEDHFAALKAARAAGQAVIGCYHSHPRGAARPSQTDLAGAGEEGFVWLIAAGGALAGFVFENGRFVPVALAISP